MARIPFLSEAQVAQMHGLIERGFATAQAMQRPQPIVTVSRYDQDAEDFLELGEIHMISVNFGLREGREYFESPVQQRYADGDCVQYADDEIILETGDRFNHQGITMEVLKVFPEDQGVIKAEIRMLT